MSLLSPPQAPHQPLAAWAGALADLAEAFGPALRTDTSTREQHGRGEGYAQVLPPDAVLLAVSTEQVARAVSICARWKIPVIPYGAGTSLEGHITAPFGGLSIDLSGMDTVLRVSPDDLDCTVQAGVTREQLNAHLRDKGLFFPIDPGANATLGGMSSTRASGTNAVRYGTMMSNVLALTVVLPDGSVIHTGGRARKSAAGYDLTRLFVGSEGTLGVITEVTLRLYGIPEAMSAATCAFETLEAAVATVVQLVQSGVPVARAEFMDEVQVAASNRHSNLGLPEKPHIFFEFHGSTASVAEQAATASELAQANGGGAFAWATLPEDRARLWKARHQAYFAALALRPASEVLSTDVCVPVSALVEVVAQTRRDIDTNRLIAPIVGHVGDGNFHVLFHLRRDDPDEMARVDAVHEAMIARALAAGGTCTGEHGIGAGKRDHLVDEHGAAAVALMRSLKRTIDPAGIMNPGKVFLD
ncbi:FAD-binding oxidoreductase [Phenylobacterium sp.]|uniref:FAD-binding oxidoreductase n=1 Tax=Phenylobacterium sp. TaxID=1871053 RepID=UPI002732FF33|nr:FAD-linked oxidase C-terminal domain-containing protein [Phenylobacterium sp.]MDP3660301.1 FAD-linked oxidase C-terminal domain-containing protein [Phenylobacterium sp.]